MEKDSGKKCNFNVYNIRGVYKDLPSRVSSKVYTADDLDRLRVIAEKYLTLRKLYLGIGGRGHEVKSFNFFK